MSLGSIEQVRAAVAGRATTATAVAEQHYAKIEAEDGPSGKNIHSFLALSRIGRWRRRRRSTRWPPVAKGCRRWPGFPSASRMC